MPQRPPDDLKSALEARMGEMASLLAEVAEALTYYPGELIILDGSEAPPADRQSLTINARDWPSIQEIEQLIANWRALSLVADSRTPERKGG